MSARWINVERTYNLMSDYRYLYETKMSSKKNELDNFQNNFDVLAWVHNHHVPSPILLLYMVWTVPYWFKQQQHFDSIVDNGAFLVIRGIYQMQKKMVHKFKFKNLKWLCRNVAMGTTYIQLYTVVQGEKHIHNITLLFSLQFIIIFGTFYQYISTIGRLTSQTLHYKHPLDTATAKLPSYFVNHAGQSNSSIWNSNSRLGCLSSMFIKIWLTL